MIPVYPLVPCVDTRPCEPRRRLTLGVSGAADTLTAHETLLDQRVWPQLSE
jgi:hypothetical protein